MNFEMQPYIVYVKTDEQNHIRAVNSSAFLTDTDGWIEIDKGFSDKYHHAQGNYFTKPLFDERGIPQYMIALQPDGSEREAWCIYEYDGDLWAIYERSVEEMDSDFVEPVADTFELDMLADHEYRLCCLELGI